MQNENQSRSRNASDSTQSSDVYIGRTDDDQKRDATGAGETTQLESVSSRSTSHAHDANTPIVVQLREEELGAQKQWAEAGAVLVRKEIETTTETLPVQVGYEEVYVDRVPVNRVLGDDETIAPRQEGDTWIVPVVEEELVVMKRRVVREELRITKQLRQRQEQVSGEVRKERLNIETTGGLESTTRDER